MCKVEGVCVDQVVCMCVYVCWFRVKVWVEDVGMG